MRRVFEQGAYADRAFRAQADRYELSGRDRAFAMRLSYGTIQRKATLDWVIERLTGRSVKRLDPPLLAALRLGLYQIAYLSGVPDHAAVDESVELAKRRRYGSGHRLANAVLRRATSEARPLLESLPDETPAEAAIRHSHPRWIAELWFEMFGRDEALALMEQDNEPPESAVRANTLKLTAEELATLLAHDGIRSRANSVPPEAVVLEQPYDVHASALFKRGLLMPQSRASMLVTHVLDPQPGEWVLDLCAAPGAKTTHIAELMRDQGTLVAVDLDPRRLRAVVSNCERLGLTCVDARQGDAREPRFGGGFDRVLVDPPCSDLGTLQSRPDVRWRKRPAQLSDLEVMQRELLEAGAAALRGGGTLVYSTCTIREAENRGQIADFLGANDGFSPIDLSAQYPHASRSGSPALQTLPHRHATDGFFIAALRRAD